MNAQAPTRVTPRPVRGERPKPTLREQADLVRYITESWKPPTDARFGVAPVWLSPSEIEDLQAIRATLQLCDRFNVGEFLRREMAKGKR